MREENQKEDEQKAETHIEYQPPVLIASADDFEATDLETPLNGLNRADDYAMERAFADAAGTAKQAGNESAERGYRLLHYICTVHLRPEDPAEPWAPRFSSREGRSHTASDFRAEQNTVLAGIANRISHPALRARVYDIVWYNDRKQWKAASAAIDAYSEAIQRRLDGTYASKFEDHDSLLDLVVWLDRALQIGAMSRKRGDLPEAIRSTFAALYQRARDEMQYAAFEKTANLGLAYRLIEPDRLAPEAEQLAEEAADSAYTMAVQSVWDLAVRAYDKIGDESAKRRCQERSVDETLKMREQVDSSSARAYWTRKAIGELRAASGFKDRINALRKELRAFQEASLDEFGQFTIPLDLTEERQGTIEIFEGLTLPDALLQFALLAPTPRVQDLRRQAMEGRETSILSSIMGATYSDHEGKTIAETPAGPFDGEPDEPWLKAQYLQILDIWRHQVVGGGIEPARRTIMVRFPLELRHFVAIVNLSPFVPPRHKHLFALGFARLFQGDAASAAYLLIPQLENSLRHVMLNANLDTSKIKSNLLQEDRSLSGMIEALRPEMEEVFGQDFTSEIELLFVHKPGPQLRHEAAHGKLSGGECFSAATLYATWLIYRLTIIPLVKHWREHVAPAIEQTSL